MTTPTGGGNAGGGAGGMGGLSPRQQQQQNEFGAAVERRSRTGGSVGGAAGGLAPGMIDIYGTHTKTDTGHGSAKAPIVYLGTGPGSNIAYMGVDDAINMYYKWDTKTKNRYLSQLSLAGYDTGSMKDDELASVWAKYVTSAARYSLAGKWASPWEIMGKDIAQREAAAKTPKTITQTAKSYNISTAADAQALFQGAAQTLLGRDPTKSEISRFKSVLNKYEQANPSVTTTTSNYIGSDLQSQTSKTTGGVSAASQQLMAQEQAKKNPEYGAYQAATNGMNWLMEMIGGG